MSEREFGTVKWFNDEKGYGFITRENGEDVFVSSKAIELSDSKTLKEGQKVSFIAVQAQGGQQADKVRPEDERGVS